MVKQKKYRCVWDTHVPDKEKNTLPSLTVPDEGLTVRQILNRYANGTIPDLSSDQNYTEDANDLRFLDMSELLEIRKQTNLQINKLRKKEADEESERKKLEEIENQRLIELGKKHQNE